MFNHLHSTTTVFELFSPFTFHCCSYVAVGGKWQLLLFQEE